MGDPANNQTERNAEIINWWKQLVTPPEKGQPSRRGELAQLRRCRNLEEVFFIPAYQHLFYQVKADHWGHERLAAIAGLLANVKESAPEADAADQPKTVANILATPTKPGMGPRVSELRFQRLVAIKDIPELYPALRRIIHLAGDRVPVPDLIQSVRYWSEKTRSDWTFRYYDTLLKTEGTH